MDQKIKQENFSEDSHRFGYLSLIGPANAGKSTLLNRIIGEKVSIVSPKAQTTRAKVLAIKSAPDYQLVFIDTPGFVSKNLRGELNRMLNLSRETAVSEVDEHLLVLDAKSVLQQEDYLRDCLSQIKRLGIKSKPIVILNKVDKLKPGEVLEVISLSSKAFESSLNLTPEFFPISALKGTSIEELEKYLVKVLPTGPALFPADMLTDRDDRFLVSEIVREKTFLLLNKELPYSIVVEVAEIKEKKRGQEKLISISAEIIVERTSQKAIVLGKGGSKIKEIGVAARTDLEKIFQAKVFLDLHVRVEENWTRSRRFIEQGANLGLS